MKTFFALALAAFVIIASFFAVVLLSSLAISSANSWIIGGNFSDAWTLCMNRKFVVFGWAALFFSIIAIVSRQGNR